MPNYEQEAYGLIRLQVYSAIDAFSEAHPRLRRDIRSFRSSIAKRVIGNIWSKRQDFYDKLKKHQENKEDGQRS